MRTTLFVALTAILLTAGGVSAQTTRTYDERGRPTGRVDQRGNEFRHYDRDGRATGRTQITRDGYRQYDRDGKLVGQGKGQPVPTMRPQR